MYQYEINRVWSICVYLCVHVCVCLCTCACTCVTSCPYIRVMRRSNEVMRQRLWHVLTDFLMLWLKYITFFWQQECRESCMNEQYSYHAHHTHQSTDYDIRIIRPSIRMQGPILAKVLRLGTKLYKSLNKGSCCAQ